MKKDVKNYLALFTAAVMLVAACSDKDPEPQLPWVVTFAPWKIELDRAVGEGSILEDGGCEITARGFVWSLQSEPTLADKYTIDGLGSGQFTSLMTGLEPDQSYYARAYATNCVGTAYGTQLIFKTCKGSVSDIDGNEYFTVAIGNRHWMTENLRVTRYANGDPIPTNLNDGSWQNADFGAYAIYPPNLIGLGSDNEVVEAYGLLYNWFVVADPRGICPAGWRVPDNLDWTYLFISLGWVAGQQLKSRRTDPANHPRWWSPNDASDQSGWSALPGGRRLWDGRYSGLGCCGNWLSATERDSLHVFSEILRYNLGSTYRNYSGRQNANSIRCVRDAEDD